MLCHSNGHPDSQAQYGNAYGMPPKPYGGIVSFRTGDWKCGNEGCGYNNFAKKVSCLRRSRLGLVRERMRVELPVAGTS